jgi:ubiquitin carboxyl-terminal hydrolase L5
MLQEREIADNETILLAMDADGMSQEVKEALADKITTLKATYSSELDKLRSQREENARRRHNYIPLIVILLRSLARRGLLKDIVSSGKERYELRRSREANR